MSDWQILKRPLRWINRKIVSKSKRFFLYKILGTIYKRTSKFVENSVCSNSCKICASILFQKRRLFEIWTWELREKLKSFKLQKHIILLLLVKAFDHFWFFTEEKPVSWTLEINLKWLYSCENYKSLPFEDFWSNYKKVCFLIKNVSGKVKLSAYFSPRILRKTWTPIFSESHKSEKKLDTSKSGAKMRIHCTLLKIKKEKNKIKMHGKAIFIVLTIFKSLLVGPLLVLVAMNQYVDYLMFNISRLPPHCWGFGMR